MKCLQTKSHISKCIRCAPRTITSGRGRPFRNRPTGRQSVVGGGRQDNARSRKTHQRRFLAAKRILCLRQVTWIGDHPL